MKYDFCEQILKDFQILNFMKIPLFEGKLCCVDGLTDRHAVANSRLLLACKKESQERDKIASD